MMFTGFVLCWYREDGTLIPALSSCNRMSTALRLVVSWPFESIARSSGSPSCALAKNNRKSKNLHLNGGRCAHQ